MQDGEGLQGEQRSNEDASAPRLATLERAIATEWRRFRPGGEAAGLRREMRRRQRTERRLRSRRRVQRRWLARRERRELASLERRLIGRGRAGFFARFSRSQEVPEPDLSSLDARITTAVEGALARQREQLMSEFQQTLDFRVRLAVKAMEHRQQESEEKAVQRANQSINNVTDEMLRIIDTRLEQESKRIVEEIERSVGAEMGRMYLRLSKPAEGGALPGRRP